VPLERRCGKAEAHGVVERDIAEDRGTGSGKRPQAERRGGGPGQALTGGEIAAAHHDADVEHRRQHQENDREVHQHRVDVRHIDHGSAFLVDRPRNGQIAT
jgi:hypothetical protein